MGVEKEAILSTHTGLIRAKIAAGVRHFLVKVTNAVEEVPQLSRIVRFNNNQISLPRSKIS